MHRFHGIWQNCRSGVRLTSGADVTGTGHRHFATSLLHQFHEIPKESSEFQLALDRITRVITLGDVSNILTSLHDITSKEGWDIRRHPIHQTILNLMKSKALETTNVQLLIEALESVIKFPKSSMRSEVCKCIADQIMVHEAKVSAADLATIIILFYKSDIKGVEYLNWVRLKLSGSLDKLPSETILRVASALDRWSPRSFRPELSELRASILKNLQESKDFDRIMKRLNVLRGTGMLNTHTIVTLRERFLDVGDSLTLSQKVTLYGTCSRLRLFSWKSVRPLLFPSNSIVDKMPSSMIAEVSLLEQEDTKRMQISFSDFNVFHTHPFRESAVY